MSVADSQKGVREWGMPSARHTSLKGNLYINFKVHFPESGFLPSEEDRKVCSLTAELHTLLSYSHTFSLSREPTAGAAGSSSPGLPIGGAIGGGGRGRHDRVRGDKGGGREPGRRGLRQL